MIKNGIEKLKIAFSLLSMSRYRYPLLAGLVGALTALVLLVFLPENGAADLYAYYGVNEGETVLFLNSEQLEAPVLYEGSRCYLPLETVQQRLNGRFYSDEESGSVLYVLPEETSCYVPDAASGELITREGVQYLAMDVILPCTQVTEREFSDENGPRRLWLWTDFETEQERAIVRKDTVLRTEGSKLGRVITEENSGAEVLVLEEKGRWTRVMTANGHVGYVPGKHLLESHGTTAAWDGPEIPEFPVKTVSGRISMGFDYIDNVSYGLDMLKQHLETERAVNILAPTWFVLHGAEGEFSSCADPEYVKLAHENGKQVWVMIENITGGCDTEALLKSRTARENLVQNLTQAVEACGADGINLDFESMSEDLIPHYLQFIRELKQVCLKKDLVLSADTFTPYSWNLKYDHKELGKVLDYVIVMCYDESWEEPGPNSDLEFVDYTCRKSLEMIPAEKLVIAVPFYTRAWALNDSGAWTRQEVYMRDCKTLMDNCVDLEWLDDVGCYHGHVDMDGVEKEIWFEDYASAEQRLNRISGYVLKGIAFWRLGQEDPAVWDLVRWTDWQESS